MLKEMHSFIFEIDYKFFIYNKYFINSSKNAIFLLNLFTKKSELLNSGFLVRFFLT